MSLIACTYLLDIEDRARLASQFDRLAAVAASVPTLRLRVRRDRRRLRQTARALRARLESLVPGPSSVRTAATDAELGIGAWRPGLGSRD
jgi:hypothetical protein